MPKKCTKSVNIAPEEQNWYLRDWMKFQRVTQANLAKACGWSNSTMHGIYHDRTAYYRGLVNLIAEKLDIEPCELLMHPNRAMALRRMRIAAEEIVTLAHDAEERAKVPESKKTGTDGQ